jgi:homoserine trans-succinylase
MELATNSQQQQSTKTTSVDKFYHFKEAKSEFFKGILNSPTPIEGFPHPRGR